MHRTRTLAALAVLPLFALTACSTDDESSAEPSASVTYDNVNAVRVAFNNAGGTCEGSTAKPVKAGGERIDCDDSTSILMYTTDQALETGIGLGLGSDRSVLHTDSWTIESADTDMLRHVQDALHAILEDAAPRALYGAKENRLLPDHIFADVDELHSVYTSLGFHCPSNMGTVEGTWRCEDDTYMFIAPKRFTPAGNNTGSQLRQTAQQKGQYYLRLNNAIITAPSKGHLAHVAGYLGSWPAGGNS